MSDGGISAVAGHGKGVAGLGRLQDSTGTVYLSRQEISRLSESGTRCLIVSLPSEYRRFGDADEAVIIEASPRRKPRRSGSRTLQAIVVGACVGASTGISMACTFLIMTQKTPVSVVDLIERALTLFA